MSKMTKNISIRVVILDNQTLVREGLRFIIQNQSDMLVVGQAGNLNEAMEVIASTRPNIILIDQDSESGLSFEVFPEINKAWGQARMILVTGSKDREAHLQAVHYGVLGIVSKNQTPEVLIKAINKVHSGEVWIEHSLIANVLTNSFRGLPEGDPDSESIKQLSVREREVINFIGRGLKNKQIANYLCIVETTVRHHLTSIYSKLGVSDRLELLVFAQRHKLTKIDENN